MSRMIYKGSKIDWGEDECAGPLEKPQRSRKETLPTKKKDVPPVNRFQLLNMDGSEDGSLDENHDTNGITFQSSMSAATAGVVV